MSLPYIFNSPIFSALSNVDDLVASVDEHRQITFIKRIPDIMPLWVRFVSRRTLLRLADQFLYHQQFHFQGIGPIGLHRYEISIVLDGEKLDVVVQGDEVVATSGGPTQPFTVAYQEEKNAFR